ncbi:MAG: hypothetical protein R2874_07600 [Desulfobacterales bacterium]
MTLDTQADVDFSAISIDALAARGGPCHSCRPGRRSAYTIVGSRSHATAELTACVCERNAGNMVIWILFPRAAP